MSKFKLKHLVISFIILAVISLILATNPFGIPIKIFKILDLGSAIPIFIFYLAVLNLFILLVLGIFKLWKKKRFLKSKKKKQEKITLGHVFAYIIPLLILGYVVYFNWLPFGFEKTYVLDVGETGDTTTTKEIYLEKTDALSNIKQDETGKTYRDLNGTTSIILKPKAILKNPRIEVSIEGEGVSAISPQIDFNPNYYKWDLDIDFSKGIPDFLKGNAEFSPEKKCAYFDGQSRLTHPNTTDQFEEGPFTVYAEWIPEKAENSQQIIGHYNWEVFQDKDKVKFRVGRMYDQGPAYSISYNIKEDFFNNKHKLLAIYNPSQKETEAGYIQLYVDGKFAQRTEFGNETIWRDYGSKDLSFGKSSHGIATYFQGSVCNSKFSYKTLFKTLLIESNKIEFVLNQTIEDSLKIPLFGQGKIEKIELKVKKA